MARPTKQGIDYFPLDCAFDSKTEMYLMEKGANGLAVLVTLWQMIYSNNGYYLDNCDDLKLLIKRRIDVGINEVSDCINASLRRGVFDNDMNESYKILTSKAIQKRYFDAAKKKKNVQFVVNYGLIDVSVYGNIVNVCGNATNVKEEVKVNVKVKVNTSDKSPEWLDEYKNTFWSAYLKKVDKSKTMALLTKMIKKNPDVEHWQMVFDHIQQKAVVTEKQYWPAPTRFLRDELWQDELPTVGENNGQHKQLNQQSAKPTAAERVRARAELKRAERRNAEPSVGSISPDIRQQPDNPVGRGNAPGLGNLIERASSKSNLGGFGNT